MGEEALAKHGVKYLGHSLSHNDAVGDHAKEGEEELPKRQRPVAPLAQGMFHQPLIGALIGGDARPDKDADGVVGDDANENNKHDAKAKARLSQGQRHADDAGAHDTVDKVEARRQHAAQGAGGIVV